MPYRESLIHRWLMRRDYLREYKGFARREATLAALTLALDKHFTDYDAFRVIRIERRIFDRYYNLPHWED